MGEAKRRGTFEQRKSDAIRREMMIRAVNREIEYRKQSPRRSAVIAAAMAIAAGASLK